MNYTQMIRLGSTIIIGSLVWFVYTMAQTGARKISVDNLKCMFSFSDSCTYYLQPYTPILIYVGIVLMLLGMIKGMKEGNSKD